MATVSQVQAALLAHFLGDAMGAPFEFPTSGAPIPLEKIPADRMLQTRSNRRYGRPCGYPTDDSRLTRLLAESLIGQDYWVPKRGATDADRTWQARYQRGFTRVPSGCFGRQLHAARDAFRSGTPVPTGAQSNGSLMACAPIGLVSAPLDVRLGMAREFTNLTHPSDVCVDTNQEYITVLDGILNGVVPDEIPLPDGHTPWGWSKGWCRMSLAIAVGTVRSVMLDDVDVVTALREVISLGGDTDTNAAIAGALIGAAVGVETLMKDAGHLLDDLVWRDEAIRIGEELALAVV